MWNTIKKTLKDFFVGLSKKKPRFRVTKDMRGYYTVERRSHGLWLYESGTLTTCRKTAMRRLNFCMQNGSAKEVIRYGNEAD